LDCGLSEDAKPNWYKVLRAIQRVPKTDNGIALTSAPSFRTL